MPFGYVTGEGGLPIEHPENAKGLIMAFEAYSTGRYSDSQVAEILNREGYRTTGNWGKRLFTIDTVNKMLQNTFYLGLTKYKGDVFPGVHPPLISQELFDKCQEVRERRAKRPKAFGQKKRVYVLAGIVRCNECGLTLRCAASKSAGQWRYYRHTAKARGYDCSVPGKFVRADKLEAEWSAIVSAISLPADWKQHIEAMSGDIDQRETIMREREEIQEKLRRLKRLYKDLLIDDEEYRASAEELQVRLSSLVLPSGPHLMQAGEYLENLGQLWSATTLQEQQDITRVMLKAMYVDVQREEIISIEPLPIFRMLFTEVCGGVGVAIISD